MNMMRSDHLPGFRRVYGLSLLVLCASFLGPALSHASQASPSPPGGTVDFARDIQPILQARCTSCHGSEVHMSELRLDSRASALRGGKSGRPAIIPGKSSESILIQYVSEADSKIVMPPTGERLAPSEIALLRRWIDHGADWPESAADAKHSGPLASEHWAFKAVQAPPIPEVKDATWTRNPIDRFVQAKLESRGWAPSPPAAPPALLRRIYLDLIGMPPSPAEQQAFLRSPSPTALDHVIADLLARPAYGERWARHWLDLVRYAETNGYERDAIKPLVWRYRDYVIRSLNDDKPFDRFVLEQLAGDELPDAGAETLIATGFYRLGPWDDEPADPKSDRYDQLDDIVSTTAQVFLGLTLGCARCHDHKFEPLTQTDYYGMVAIFSGLQRPRNGRTELDLPIGPPDEVEAEIARDRLVEAFQRQIAEVRHSHRLEALASKPSNLPAEAIAAFLTEPEMRDEVQKSLVAKFSTALDEAIDSRLPADEKAKIESIKHKIQQTRALTDNLPRGYYLVESDAVPPSTHVLIRGKAGSHGPEVSPGMPAVLVDEDPVFPKPQRTSLRRLTLARWIASPENPLTARVIVNRVWQHHFGEGLVRTPSDFGRMGERPTHPQLLDWLASWFVEEGWSIKKLHRLILTSNTYRMSKSWKAQYGAEDPENRWLWRVSPRRLEVEAIWDSALVVSGRLNSRMFGPSMYPFVPEAALQGHSDPDKIWKPFDETDASRRAIYAFTKRSLLLPLFEVLDFCDTSRSSASRQVTSVAPQALSLFNGDFVNRQARHLAHRLEAEAGPDAEEQIERAYLLTLCRPVRRSEKAEMMRFLKRETAQHLREISEAGSPASWEAARRQALEQMCRVILNLNEFAYTD
ncbi:MAG: PSD1 and planctomycete cytochrome C domain-containing protein [Acidobacteriota bacterium]